MSKDMDQEIRDNAGDEMNKNIQSPEGAKRLPDPDSNTGGVPDPSLEAPATDAGSTEDQVQGVHQAAEKAQAAFAGTADLPGKAGVVESEADGSGGSTAQSSESDDQNEGLGEVSGGFNPDDVKDAGKDDESEDKQPGTGAMMAGVLASDDNMKWESKIVSAFSDTESTSPTESDK